MTDPRILNLAALGGRFFLSLIFILSGWSKIGGYAGTQAYMAKAGLPGALLPLVILVELGGGLCILFGFQTRIAAFFVGGFALVSALAFHTNFGDQAQMVNFMKNLAIMGGFMALYAAGPGAYSIDAMMGSRVGSLKRV